MINTRVLMKTDTTANWETLTTFVPLKGEVIIYEDMEPLGIKVGDGTTLLSALKFSSIPQADEEGDFLRVQADGSYASESITLINGGSSVDIADVSFANAEVVSF